MARRMDRFRRSLPLLGVLAALAALAPSAGASTGPAPSKATPRIVGGQTGDIAAWPFLAAIVRHDVADGFQAQFCGGSLVAPRVVLTAAHCIDGRDVDVVLGRTRLSSSAGERIRVVAQLRAPGYDPRRNQPDLALLVLERPASAAPIALADRAPGPGTRVEVAGWGLTAQEPEELSPDDLQQASVTVLPSRRCLSAYGSFVFTGAAMICAGTPEAGVPDSCNGDSGGPLIVRAAEGPRLVGVVSYGSQTCGNPDAPAVYASVPANRRWLDGELTRIAGGELPSQPDVAPADPSTIRLRFGKMACPTNLCYVDIRTSGPVESLTGGLVLWVHRRRPTVIDRFALAERVSAGRWRAWVNLPFGRLRLIAVGVDEDADPVTRLARTWIRVTPR
jgi:trypsin